MCFKNAFSNAFTNSLERKKHAFILRVCWLLISELYCDNDIYCTPHGRDWIFQGGGGVSLPNFPVGRGGDQRDIFPEGV